MRRSLSTCTSLALLCASLLPACGGGGGGGGGDLIGGDGIRVNQVGYSPDAQKLAVVVGGTATAFTIVDATTDLPAGAVDRPLSDASTFSLSGETVRVADFSDVTAPGTYRIEVADLDPSYEFEIGSGVYESPALASLKAFYYWRASMPIDQAHGGAWRRAAGHPNTGLRFHTSTHPADPETETWDAPGGWYDAGDYGEYVVNAGITVGTMLALHELFPGAFPGDVAALNIPESTNEESDLLDEVKYELDWLLDMQDTDGGVFFKIAGLVWPGWIAPAQDNQPRYVIGKSTTSALDFAAVMAQAARVYKEYDIPFANECLIAARGAYEWALDNPDVAAPSVTGSGAYGDDDSTDEFTWAAAELYLTTQDPQYLADPNLAAALATIELDGYAGWKSVKNLAYYSLATRPSPLDATLRDGIRAAILAKADEHLATMGGNAYRFPLGHYSWGSASQVANVGVLLVYAAELAEDVDRPAYRNGAVQAADYVLGKNSTGYSFLTGFGTRSPGRIHHRPSEADGARAPVPGLLTGGPNSGLQDLGNGTPPVRYTDRCSLQHPAFCFTDSLESFSSNEPAINQNAAAFFLFAALDALQGD